MKRTFAAVLGAVGTTLVVFAAYELTAGVQRQILAIHLPPRHLQALVALAFASLAAGLALSNRPATAVRRAVLVGLLAAVSMLANTRLIGSGDTRPAAYLPFAIARTHSLAFDGLIATNRCLMNPDGSLPYWFVKSRERTVSRYPLTTGLLALPLELPSALGTFDLCSDDFNDLEKLTAAILSAFGVALLFLALRSLTGERSAILATALYVGATPVLPILGQALWQHVGACLGFSLSAFALVALRRGTRRTALGALGVGLAIACRPPDLFLALGFGAALLVEERRLSAAWLWGALPLATLALCNWVTLGSPLATGYGAEVANGWTAFWPDGLAGLLVSPARGLLLLYPITLFAIGALVRPRLEPVRGRQLRLLAAGALGHWLLMAKWWCWTGGYAAGPRMLSDALPILGLGLGLVAEQALATRGRWLLAPAALSLLCAGLVTYVPPTSLERDRIWSLTEGPWSWRAYPPMAYWP